jgi:hypothetical protein
MVQCEILKYFVWYNNHQGTATCNTLVWWYFEGYHNFMSFAPIGWLMFWLQMDTCLLCHRWIDWKALQERGFKGVIFDKDNTLTAPYALAVWPALAPALQECQSFFNGHIALLSNSAGTSTAHLCFFSPWTKCTPHILNPKLLAIEAVDLYKRVWAGVTTGLYQFDPEGAEANAVEERLGIPVIRHSMFVPSSSNNLLLCVLS